MPVKSIVQTLDGIPDHYKADYKPIEGGQGFFFDLEDFEAHPRAGALKRAKDREATEATNAKTALKTATEALEVLKGEHDKLNTEFEERLRGAVGSKEEDLARLDQKWAEKVKKANEEGASKVAQRDAALNKVLVLDAARAIVANMKPAEPEYIEVILPHVVKRLTVEIVGDEGRTRVLDQDGKPSADTIDELTDHFRLDKRFAPLLTGSRATGGSANGSKGSGGNGSAGPIDLTKATLEQKAAHYKAKQGIAQ
jgi:hypothetical protein